MPQPPTTHMLLPNVLGSKPINHLPKVCLGNGHVVQTCRMIFFGKFTVKAANQSNRLFTRQKLIADLMTSLCRTPTKTKFDVLHVIVEAVDFIIQAGMLGIGALGTLWVQLKPTVLLGIIKVFLRNPAFVVRKKMVFDAGICNCLGVRQPIEIK